MEIKNYTHVIYTAQLPKYTWGDQKTCTIKHYEKTRTYFEDKIFGPYTTDFVSGGIIPAYVPSKFFLPKSEGG